MGQNRGKLVELFIGNISNAVVHEILEKAVRVDFMAGKYRKELITSFEIAKRYREKINPVDRPLPTLDCAEIKRKIISRVNSELMLRISKGYTGLDISSVEPLVDKMLKDLIII